MEKTYRVLAVNPGSTSTKIAVFDNDKEVYSKNVKHEAAKLAEFAGFQDQLDYRKETVEAELVAAGIDLDSIDVYAGRGGGLVPVAGGTYEVTEKLLDDAANARSGAHHTAQLASQICAMLQREHRGRCFVVNPPDVDEYHEIARYTGFRDVYRASHVHALNHKEVALRYCKARGLRYTETDLIVCHIGGGISVAAHKQGRMVDSNDLLAGEGSMMPTRSGALPAIPLVRLCYSGRYTEKEMINRINKEGGLIDHLGTSDAIEVEERIGQGDQKAKDVYDAMIYQIAKSVGSCACVLKGEAKAILLTGGISHSKYLTEALKEYIGWIAPVEVMAGEFEMEALAAGALRVVTGEEKALEYTGIPVWTLSQAASVSVGR